jgi:phthiocerol/phenolphthiocerol synthesis type-I polyketide synthase B
MTSAFDEAAVRGWLVDYLVTNNGCSPEHIDRGASMHDLGVGSRDAVVLTGVLAVPDGGRAGEVPDRR